MSNTKAKTTFFNVIQDAQLEYVLSFNDTFLQAQMARGLCYSLDNQILWLSKNLADDVAELDGMSDDARKGIERMSHMRLEKQIERTTQQIAELRVALDAAIEVHAQCTTKAPYERRSK
jgi:hypothetical protein